MKGKADEMEDKKQQRSGEEGGRGRKRVWGGASVQSHKLQPQTESRHLTTDKWRVCVSGPAQCAARPTMEKCCFDQRTLWGGRALWPG